MTDKNILDGQIPLKGILEALLFVADEPLSLNRLSEITGETKQAIKDSLEQLRSEYVKKNRGFQLREIAGGYRLYTHPAYAPYIEKLVLSSDFRRLTQASLETLAIIAYKQPLTRQEIGEIRGVNAEAVISSLLEKGLIEEAGKKDAPGQPILYRTSRAFLEAFGMKGLDDLPPIEEFEPDETTRRQIEEKLRAEIIEEID
jgi:segregation and condensation protein B